jgi:protein-tyrosine phosphatase
LSALKARRVEDRDFERFDLILAADKHNLAELRRRCPAEHQNKLALMLEALEPGGGREVPDPYYGGPSGFDRVLDMLERACDAWLERLRSQTSML